VPAHTPNPILVRINARAAADERGLLAAPARLTIRLAPPLIPGPPTRSPGIEIVRLSTPTDSPAADREPDLILDRPRAILIPALVNAHAHLDLTHLGPRPHDPAAGFVAWVDMVRAGRERDNEAIAASVRMGVELAIRGGTAAIGDIAGAPAGIPNLAPFNELRRSPLAGISYLEFFAIGRGEAPALARVGAALDAAARQGLIPGAGAPVRLGLQPHAPNTVGLGAYLWAARRAHELDVPLCTHLAETPEEAEFVANASGPQRELLERFGLWDDAIDVGRGRRPIEHLRPFLDACAGIRPPPLLVHLNDLGPDMDLVRASGASVAYCPRASAYFGAPDRFGPHRYRELLGAGVNVCLGTDSIVGLPAAHASGDGARLSVLDDMRLLRARDRTDPALLLSMGTTRAAGALGLDPRAFRLDPGPIAGLLAIETPPDEPDPLAGALSGQSPPEFLYLRNHACQTAKTTAG